MSTPQVSATPIDIAAKPAQAKRYLSPGVNAILASLTGGGKSNILDLGMMNQNNVAFFSHYNCKLFVEDIAPSLEEINSGADIDDYLLNYGEDTQFDAIFAWDIFNYLDLKQLARLISRIKKNCRPDALMHVMVYANPTISAMPRRFSLIDKQTIEVASAEEVARQFPQYSAFDLLSHLPQFVAQDTWLSREDTLPGTLEYTFRFNPRRLRPVRRSESPALNDAQGNVATESNRMTHMSPAMVHIFDQISAVKRTSRVLDLGAPISANITAFKSAGCEIFVENLSKAVGGLEKRLPNGKGREKIGSQMLDYGDESPFDIILLWDIFNYLQLNQVELMAHKLRAICKRDSKLYCLNYTHKTMPASPRQFEITDNRELHYQDTPGQLRSIPYFTTLDLLKRMRGFAIEKTYLLQAGMQSGITELIIKYKG